MRGHAHINSVESFCPLLTRSMHSTHHHLSSKHLARYVNEFAEKHNIRPCQTPKTALSTAKNNLANTPERPPIHPKDINSRISLLYYYL